MNGPLFVIGDIHGCHIELLRLMDMVEQYTKKNDLTDYDVCFVGDYIDRGPNSMEVIEEMIWLGRLPNFHFLMGNHEQMCVEDSPGWLMNGGSQTNYSYPNMRVSDSHREWMSKLPIGYVKNNVAVCHAGINEYTEINTTDEHQKDMMLWDRSLRTTPHTVYKYTVHGHTPMQKAMVSQHTAYIDTACVFGGSLTALFIPDTVNPDWATFRLFSYKKEDNND